MLLIKRISQEFKRPVFEIMNWPNSEIEYQAAFLSIDECGEKPKKKIVEPSVEESIAYLKRTLGE